MKKFFPALLLGAAIAFAAASASAQEPQAAAQNSPSQGGQAATAATKKKGQGAPALTAGQFAGEAEAKAHCPGEVVVWVNVGTKIYHRAGAASYGATKRGAYMCEKDTAAAGFRAAKNQKRK